MADRPVGGQPLLGQLLVLRPRHAVIDVGIDADAASGSKDACHLDIAGVHQVDKVVQHDIHAVLVDNRIKAIVGKTDNAPLPNDFIV